MFNSWFQNDVAHCRKVLGFIHCIAVGDNGLNLALGYCERNRTVVCLVEEPTFGTHIHYLVKCS